MDLIVKDRVIEGSVIKILEKLRDETNGRYFNQIIDKGDYVSVQCPFHKNGQETHPSCSVYNSRNNDSVPFGTVHCFTCGYKSGLVGLVANVLEITIEDAEDWLTQDYASDNREKFELLDEINLEPEIIKTNYLDESILDKYNGYHEYMWKRKLTKEVVDFFRIGYDKDKQCITFPTWDAQDHLLFVSERSVNSKRFYIPATAEKPIYLLNFILRFGYDTMIVVESQINALTCWVYGHPAGAMFGTGSAKQYEILKKSCIRNYILMFDGDEAGRKGAKRFIKNMEDCDAIITDVMMPQGKDVNDLSKEEFEYVLSHNIVY